MQFQMNVLLLRGDQRQKIDVILRAFAWQRSGRTWQKDDPVLHEIKAAHSPDEALIGLNHDRGWTVIHDNELAFIDDIDAVTQLSRELETRAMEVEFNDSPDLQCIALVDSGELIRQIGYGDGELWTDIGAPLFHHVPDSEEEPEPAFPEGDLFEILDRELGCSHNDVILVDDVTILEIKRCTG